jgi:hypothetical protein
VDILNIAYNFLYCNQVHRDFLITLYLILWDYRRICGPSGVYLYIIHSSNFEFLIVIFGAWGGVVVKVLRYQS